MPNWYQKVLLNHSLIFFEMFSLIHKTNIGRKIYQLSEFILVHVNMQSLSMNVELPNSITF